PREPCRVPVLLRLSGQDRTVKESSRHALLCRWLQPPVVDDRALTLLLISRARDQDRQDFGATSLKPDRVPALFCTLRPLLRDAAKCAAPARGPDALQQGREP